MGYALACDDCDVSLPDIAALCDIFYIGGTKLGALCGEAVVFSRRKAPPRFMSIIKQHGALLAKGRLLGIQFDTLFTDDLYLENGRHALRMASRLRDAFAQKGYRFYIDSPTNQLFVILSDRQRARLEEFVAFSFWERTENGDTVVRFATGWATSPADVDALIARL